MHLKLNIFWLAFLILFSFSLVSKASEEQDQLNESNVIFNHVKIEGMHLFKYEDLEYIFKPYIGKSLGDKQERQMEIIEKLNLHYMSRGYLFSMVSGFEIQGDLLNLKILEGSVNEVVISKEIEEIKDIPYVEEYLRKLKSIKPFNMKDAEKYFFLIKRLLGHDVIITPVFLGLEQVDEKDPKTVDLFISEYKKVIGSFEVNNTFNNYISPDNTELQNIDIAHSSGYFSMGKLLTRINNPSNTPSNLNSFLSTSGDKKENAVFTQYVYQINPYGAQLKFGAGYDQFNFTKQNKKFFTLLAGIAHPLIFTNDRKLELTSNLEFYTLHRKYKENLSKNNKSEVIKATVGANYESTGFLNSYHTYILEFHSGRLNLKYNDKYNEGKSRNLKSTFNKLTFYKKMVFPILKDLDLTFYLDSQYSHSENLPVDEAFSLGKSVRGRGFLPSEIYGKSGAQTAAELSHLNRFNHPFLIAINKYIYLDTARVAKLMSSSTTRKSVSSVGIGVDAYLIDNLVVNLELNKPVAFGVSKGNGSSSAISDSHINNKKLKLFAGLKYHFAF